MEDPKDVFVTLFNRLSGRNDTACVTKIDHFKFYQYALIPSTLITLCLAMLRRRRSVLTNVLWGRPGVPIPLDPMTRVARLPYACAFGAITNLVYGVIIKRTYIFDYQGHPAWRSAVAVVSVFAYGLVFYPLFACLAMGSVLGYVLGSLYAWMLTAIEIVRLVECQTNTKGRTALVFRSLPLLLCMAYLSISLPLRAVRAAKRRRFWQWKADIEVKDTMDDILNSQSGRHVSKLFHKPAVTVMFGGQKGRCSRLTVWISRHRYRWKQDFRYPSLLLSVLLVGMLVVYMGSVESVMFVALLTDVIEKYLGFVTAAEILRVSGILSTAVAFVASAVNVLHTLACFRKNVHELYRGIHSNIPAARNYNYSQLCLGCLKFGGYQVAYIVSGFMVQQFVFLLLFLTVGVIIRNTKLLVILLERLWPWLLSLTVMLLLQRVLTIFFVQERGRHLALDNRGMFFVFGYFMFFYNLFAGLAACLIRILKSMLLGMLIVSRLDYIILPPKFDRFDNAYRAYVGYVLMDYAHTHPVLVVFTRLLLLLATKHRGDAHSSSVHLELLGVPEMVDNSSDSARRCARIRRKWQLLYTLVRNPDLVYRRKVFNQTSTTRALLSNCRDSQSV